MSFVDSITNHGFLMFTFSFFFVSEVFFCCCNALIIQKPKKHLNKPWAVWISKNPVRIRCLKHIKHLKSRRHFVFSSYHQNPREFWCPHNQIPPIKSVWRRHDATRQNRFDLMMYLAFFPKCRYSRRQKWNHQSPASQNFDQKTLSSKTCFFWAYNISPNCCRRKFSPTASHLTATQHHPPAFHMWSVLWPGAGNGCHGQCKGWECEGCLKRCGCSFWGVTRRKDSSKKSRVKSFWKMSITKQKWDISVVHVRYIVVNFSWYHFLPRQLEGLQSYTDCCSATND